MPWYAARLLKAGLGAVSGEISVLATRPTVPMGGTEEILGRSIEWLDARRSYSWSVLDQPVPALFIHTGWNIRCFNSLAREVRRNGGKVIAMIDNSYKGSARQYVGAIVFRLFIRRRFAAVIVPGRSGRRLLRFLGMPADRIVEGQYGADPDVFTLGDPLLDRPKEMLFVGQMIPRKGVAILTEAFRRAQLADRGWTLRLVGDGPERPVVRDCERIQIDPFMSEQAVAAAMRRSRIFVLPSLQDHWGVVLAEAGLSGSALVAAKSVGAAEDLITPSNGRTFRAGDAEALAESLLQVADWPSAAWERARLESRMRASQFGPARWAEMVPILAGRFSPRSWR